MIDKATATLQQTTVKLTANVNELKAEEKAASKAAENQKQQVTHCLQSRSTAATPCLLQLLAKERQGGLEEPAAQALWTAFPGQRT